MLFDSQRTKAALAHLKKSLGGYRAGAPKVDGRLGFQAIKSRADGFVATVAPVMREMADTGSQPAENRG